MTHAIDCDLDDDCACKPSRWEVTYRSAWAYPMPGRLTVQAVSETDAIAVSGVSETLVLTVTRLGDA